MEYISHRVNTINELIKIPQHCGVEIDIRDRGDKLVLVHDPFSWGEPFEEYIRHYDHGTMILNIKSERVEHKVLSLLLKYDINDYFFLDSSFPMIHLLSSMGERNIALRYSEYEGLDTVLNMAGKVNWVWVDCFTKLPIDAMSYCLLKDAGFNLCLVSPELQGRDCDIEAYGEYLMKNNIVFDAICTKQYNIPRWQFYEKE